MSATREIKKTTDLMDQEHQRQGGKRPAKQRHNQRAHPTHFLCFPLVTDESVRQLSRSLAYFRSVTTPLPASDPDATPEPDVEQRSTAVKSNVEGQRRDEVRDQKLRLLPEAAHRPPGTYHLTLGTMSLSKQEDMDKALALLQEIDYLALLRDAGTEDGIARQARTRGGRRPDHSISEGTKITTTKVKTESALEPESNPDITTQAADTKTNPQEPAATNQEILPIPGQSLKSLTRTISPPPLTVSSTFAVAHDPASPPLLVPLSISLSSLGVFPNPNAARVFFAQPSDPTHRLQTFGQLVRRRFREAGLITETRPLVLHATVANLIYVRGGGKGRGRGKGKGKWKGKGDDGTVDAREILSVFNGEGGLEGTTPSPRPDEANVLDVVAQDQRTRIAIPRKESASRPVPYIWVEDIPITSIRICKMGAEPSDKPGWGLEYRPIAEKVFMPGAS